jgi:sugar lactone lactonase YvrE
MKIRTVISTFTLLGAPVLLSGQARAPQPAPAPAPCVAGNTQFVCGQNAPEDLALVPGGEWVVATSFAGSGGLQIINVKDRRTILAYPTAASQEQFDKKTYDTCPGPPDAEQKSMFRTHGIALREGRNSRHTLFVVNHGKRESIEVFEIDARQRPPSLTWVGCVVAPNPIGLNEVIPLPEGGFIATDFLARNVDAAGRGRMMAGENNGALWEWHTGKDWKMVPGTEASGANGLEISKDAKTLYVAEWGSQAMMRVSRGQTPVKRDKIPLGFRADNIRWAPDGTLFVTGQGGMGQAQTTNIVKVDPKTLKVTEILTRVNTTEFGAGTATLQLGKELWVGSYRGDRIAIFPAP